LILTTVSSEGSQLELINIRKISQKSNKTVVDYKFSGPKIISIISMRWTNMLANITTSLV